MYKWVQEIPLILWYLWLGTGDIPLILSYLWLGTGEFRLSFGTSGWVQGNSAYPFVPLAGYRGILVVYW